MFVRKFKKKNFGENGIGKNGLGKLSQSAQTPSSQSWTGLLVIIIGPFYLLTYFYNY